MVTTADTPFDVIATIDTGSTTLVIAGDVTSWLVPNYRFSTPEGSIWGIINTVGAYANGVTTATLFKPWSGTALVNAPALIEAVNDRVSLGAKLAKLIVLFGNGVLRSFAGVIWQDGDRPKFLNGVWTRQADSDLVKDLAAAGVVTTDGASTLSNKTLAAPIISNIKNGTATLSLPAQSDTLVGRETSDTLKNKTLAGGTLSGVQIAGQTTLPGGGSIKSDGSTKLASVSGVDFGALSSASTIVARNAAYSIKNTVGGAAVDDKANGASLGFVSTFSSGWNGYVFTTASNGFVPGTYDIYARVRTDGAGSSPTSLICGVWDGTATVELLTTTTVNGLSTSYQEVYLGRFTIPQASVSHSCYLWFSNSVTTTNYFVDYIKFVPAPVGIGGPVAIGTTAPVSGCKLDVAGHIYPHAANSYALGAASYPFAGAYLQNAATVTSDENAKADIAALSDAEAAVAAAIAPLIVTYKMKSAIAAKGDALARRHCGWIAQKIEAAFLAHGLDPFAYGCVGYDLVTKSETDTRPELRPKMNGDEPVVDADGRPVMETVDVPYAKEVPDLDENGVQKRVHNIRPEEVMAFALAGLAARVSALEAAKAS